MRYALNKDVLFAGFDDGALVFNAKTHDLFKFNRTASDIVRLSKKHTKSGIIGIFAQTHGINLDRAEKDITNTIKSLIDKEILHEDNKHNIDK